MHRLLLILICIITVATALRADTNVMEDDDKIDPIIMAGVKSAYIYNFTKFVRWPDNKFANDESPFRVGIIGNDPFGEVIDKAFKGKTVAGKNKNSPDRRIEIIRIIIVESEEDKSDNPNAFILPVTTEDLENYHILFIGDSLSEHFQEISEVATEANVLTVGDHVQFTEQKGMIELVLDDNRIKLHINFERIKKTKLSVSSKLLKVADIVQEDPG